MALVSCATVSPLERSMQDVAAGLIGCGFFARKHLHAWGDLGRSGVRLVAVRDSDPAKAEAARALNVPCFHTAGRVTEDLRTCALLEAAYASPASGRRIRPASMGLGNEADAA